MRRILYIIAFTLFLCSCGQNNDSKQENDSKYKNGMESLYSWNTYGCAFGVYAKNQAESNIYLDNIDDEMEFLVESGGDKRQIAIYFLVDYKQVPIIVDGKKYEVYYIDTVGDYSKRITFSLDDVDRNKSSYKLTGVLTAYTNIYIADRDDMYYSPDNTLILNYNINVNGTKEFIDEEYEVEEPQLLYSTQGSGIIVNTEEGELISKIPNKDVHINLGEELTVQYHAGGFENNDFLIFFTIGYEQMKVNGADYLYFTNLPSMQLAAGYCNIETPNKRGRYEVMGYVIPEPFKNGEVSNFHSENSFRFTLTVE